MGQTTILLLEKSIGDPSFIHVYWYDGAVMLFINEVVQLKLILVDPASPLITVGVSDAINVGATVYNTKDYQVGDMQADIAHFNNIIYVFLVIVRLHFYVASF